MTAMTTDTAADQAGSRPPLRPERVTVLIVCFRAVELTIDCLESLEPQIAEIPGSGVLIVENGTGDDAAETLRSTIADRGWQDWAEVIPVSPNRGFSGGNNVVLDDMLTWPRISDYVLLLNADTIVRPGALKAMLEAADADTSAGVVSPRLEWPDGTPQISCFRDFHPLSELDKAAGLGPVSKLLRSRVVGQPVVDHMTSPDWTTFACALIRGEVLKKVGTLDPGFFLYFDDPDYCRRVRDAGWKILNAPGARVVHLRGKSNPAKELAKQKKRRPWYHFASRTRYYYKFYGRLGLLAANLCWTTGHALAVVRKLLTGKPVPACEREARDIWINWSNPMAMPDRGQDDKPGGAKG